MTTKRKKIRKTYIPAPLPAEGFVRLPSILAHLQISKTSFLNGIKAGKYPPGVLISPRTRAWPVEQIRGLFDKLSA